MQKNEKLSAPIAEIDFKQFEASEIVECKALNFGRKTTFKSDVVAEAIVKLKSGSILSALDFWNKAKSCTKMQDSNHFRYYIQRAIQRELLREMDIEIDSNFNATETTKLIQDNGLKNVVNVFEAKLKDGTTTDVIKMNLKAS